ncbi:MAG TPA: biopolymer transporter ExbD [Candidatus Binatia bacterium]|jgi:biopolymer transport protein ExbD
MYIASPRPKRRARIEIIPLIDIMFFLLATFLMVSLSMIRNQGISVNLPIASTSAPQDRKEYASITVTEKGDYFWNKQPANLAVVIDHLRQLKQSEPDPKVFINGDAKAHFEDVVSVLDEARKIGITKVAIETQKPK